MRKLLITCAAAMLFAPQVQAEMKPVFGDGLKMDKDYGVLYFNSEKRRDVSIMSSFISDCTDLKVACICADVSGRSTDQLKEAFHKAEGNDCLYSTDKSEESPRAEFFSGGEPVGNINEHENFTLLLPAYLKYVAKEIDGKGLEDELKAAAGAEAYKKIVPRMNFVLMLAKKGERDAALHELDGIDTGMLDDKGMLLLGQTYLRLKAPEKAHNILKDCNENECRFYSAVALHLSGRNEEAVNAFISLKKVYNDDDKINFYLKAAYKALGDDVDADKIKLPDNYNINSD
jgi:hypothetical protein